MEHKYNNNQSTPKNNNLHSAKRAKNDEFYTQWADIEKEMNAYLEYDPDVFKDKTVLLPCDDPEWSNFTKYFALNFETFGIKKLISTSYAQTVNNPRGKKFVLTHEDINGYGVVNVEDLQWEYLEGDGDFRSEEVTALRDEADIVVTNPPFSLFRDFMAWLIDGDVKFAAIGNVNAITYKEVFPLIKDNRVWLGTSPNSMTFVTPSSGDKTVNALWFTNIEHGRRHEPLKLMTEADNIKFSKHKQVRGIGYLKYTNFDAIEVPFTDAIPSDYDGVMGVPVSFLDKYNPEQFEIIGSSGELAKPMSDFAEKGTYQPGGPSFYLPQASGPFDFHRVYNRIAIRRKVDQNEDDS